MSRLLLIPLVLFLLLLGAVLLVPVLLDKDKVLQLAAAGPARTDRRHADSRWRCQTFRVSQPWVSPCRMPLSPCRDTQLSDLRIGTAAVGVQFLPLLRRQVEIDSHRAGRGQGQYASLAQSQARADTSTLSDEDLDALYEIRRKRMAASAEVSGAQAAVLPPLALHVRQLTITDARLELLDPDGAAPKVMELVRLQASDLNLDGAAIPVDIACAYPESRSLT